MIQSSSSYSSGGTSMSNSGGGGTCVVTEDELSSGNGAPSAKRQRLILRGSAAPDSTEQDIVDPVLSELMSTLKVSHNLSEEKLNDVKSDELVKDLQYALSQLSVEKPLETRLAASHYLLNVAVLKGIPNKLLFSLFEMVQKASTHVSVLNLLLKTIWVVSKNSPLVKNRLVKICIKLLATNFNRIAQTTCLEILGDVADLQSDSEQLLKFFEEQSRSHDCRIRRAALDMICHYDSRGGKISLSVYHLSLKLLEDENEKVRATAIKVVCSYAKKMPNVRIPLGDKGDDIVRLEEQAFSKICELVNDIQVAVRVTAVTSLAQFVNVDQSFLEQTLDKQLMSQLRTKMSSHERKSELVRSGAFSSGRKWGDDAPLDDVDEDSICLISSGACGALVHGLEDEFKEVRTATVETLSQLSCNRASFAKDALDFFIDMLNDEIEAVRIKSLQSLATISHHVVLRKDQMLDTLSCLDDYSEQVREKVHQFLKKVQFEEMGCLKLTLQRLLRNLKKYPADKLSIFGALKYLGSKHSTFVLPFMKELLCVHSFLDTPEPNVNDPFYISIMILVLNAAHSTHNITGLFPPFITRHHQYLKQLHPEFIPDQLDLNKNTLRFCYKRPESCIVFDVSNAAKDQYSDIVSQLERSQKLDLYTLRNLVKDLVLLRDCSEVSGVANFLSTSLRIHISMLKVYEKLAQISPTSELSLSDENVFAELNKSLSLNFSLECLYRGYCPETLSKILENRCLLSTLLLFFNLLKESKCDNSSSKVDMCRKFIQNLKIYQCRLSSNSLKLSEFSANMFDQLCNIDASKVTLISKFVHPMLLSAMSPSCGILETIVPKPTTGDSPPITISSAVINHPQNSDRVESFMAGLILALRLEVTLENVTNFDRVRIVLTYPGSTDQVVSPNEDKFTEISPDDQDSSTEHDSNEKKRRKKVTQNKKYKLNTTCFISHSSWTEPADLVIGVYLAVPTLFDHTFSLESPEKLVSIGQNVRIVIHPKPTAL